MRRRLLVAVLLLVGLGAMGATAASAGRQKTVTLVVWDWTYHVGGLLKGDQAVDKAFMAAHPNIKIDHVGFPYGPFFVKLAAAVAAKQGMDVTRMYGGAFTHQYASGLMPLGRFVKGSKLPKQLLYFDSEKATDPHLYALPDGSYAYYFLYNKGLLKKVGLTSLPTKWDGFLSMCDKLKAAGIEPLSGGYKDGVNGAFGFNFLNQVGTHAQNLAWTAGKLNWNSPLIGQALSMSLQLDQHCYGSNALGKTSGDAAADFSSGSSALYWSWSVREISQGGFDTALGGNLGLGLPPKVPGAKTWPTLDGGADSGWSITSWTKHSKEAWEYVNFVLGPVGQTILWNVGGEAPNNLAATPTPHYAYDGTWLGWIKRYHILPGFSGGISCQKEIDTWNRLIPGWAQGSMSTSDLIAQMVPLHGTC